MTITTAQMRGARGLLNWSQSELSKRTGISTTSIGNIEAGNTQPRETTLKLIRQAFENAGIEFIGTEGMRRRSNYIRTYTGRDEFWQFYEDIYDTIKEEPGEVLVSNVDERDFEKWLGAENLQTHVNRMQKIQGLDYKILVREDDMHFLATSDYCEYRWMPKELFVSVPFYLYGKKLAILIFDEEPRVIVIDNISVANSYRSQFHGTWKNSLPVKPRKVAV